MIVSLDDFFGFGCCLAVSEDVHMALAHQNYKTGNYKLALEHGSAVYEKNPRHIDNLLLLGAIYYQVFSA